MTGSYSIYSLEKYTFFKFVCILYIGQSSFTFLPRESSKFAWSLEKLVLIKKGFKGSTCFICTTWKRKQTMEQQPQPARERTKSKQKQNQITSHSN